MFCIWGPILLSMAKRLFFERLSGTKICQTSQFQGKPLMEPISVRFGIYAPALAVVAAGGVPR